MHNEWKPYAIQISVTDFDVKQTTNSNLSIFASSRFRNDFSLSINFQPMQSTKMQMLRKHFLLNSIAQKTNEI